MSDSSSDEEFASADEGEYESDDVDSVEAGPDGREDVTTVTTHEIGEMKIAEETLVPSVSSTPPEIPKSPQCNIVEQTAHQSENFQLSDISESVEQTITENVAETKTSLLKPNSEEELQQDQPESQNSLHLTSSEETPKQEDPVISQNVPETPLETEISSPDARCSQETPPEDPTSRIVHQEHHTPSSVPEIPPEAKPSFSKETTEEKDTATTSETTSEKIYERQVQQEAPTISADTSSVTTGIISGETQQSNIEEGEAVPAAIATRISTRSLSGKARTKSKPSLGAKKFGGIRLSQPPPKTESDWAHEVEAPKTSDPMQSAKTNLWHQEPVSAPVQKPTESSDGGGWGGWFAPPKSLLSSVSSLTNQIIATVETGLNIPEPEDLAKQDILLEKSHDAEPEQKEPNREDREEKSTLGFGQLIGGVGRFMESTSSKVLSTGLDTLELLGKKTITVLQHSDPGLKLTKAALINPLQPGNDRPCLSQILREAKEEASHEPETTQEAQPCGKKLMTLFEEHHGLVHMEALEMLSQQCHNRISSQLRRLTAQRRAAAADIAALCTLTDDSAEDNSDPDDFDVNQVELCLTNAMEQVDLRLPYRRLIDVIRDGFQYTSDGSDCTCEQVIATAHNSLAQVTALTVEQLHKAAELVLLTEKTAPSPLANGKKAAEAFRSIALLMSGEVMRLGNHFGNQIIRKDQSSPYATEIYFEASTYSSYIHNALRLLIPILQTRVV